MKQMFKRHGRLKVAISYLGIKDKEDALKLQRDTDSFGSLALRFQPVKCNMMWQTKKRTNKVQVSYTLSRGYSF